MNATTSGTTTTCTTAARGNNNYPYRRQPIQPPPPQQQQQQPQEEKDDLRFCIVWSPLPPITWFIPIIGHLGITDSRGIASDFRGPYYVGDDGEMAFGAPTRAVYLGGRYTNTYNDCGNEDDDDGKKKWDAAIQEANAVYRNRMHNICCDNCHSHVAYALNRLEEDCNTPRHVQARGNWNMIRLAFLVFFQGRFLKQSGGGDGSYWSSVNAQFGPFCIILLMFLLFRAFI